MFPMVSWHRPLIHDVALHWALKKKCLIFYHFLNWNTIQKQSVVHTFVTDRVFFVIAFLIVPLPSVFSCVDIDLHTELRAVVVVRLVCCPWMFTNPRAVIPDPSPSVIHVGFCDSNPVIWTRSLVWQYGDQIVILVLALDHDQVCVMSLTILFGLCPFHDIWGVMIRPAQGTLSQGVT